MKSLSKKDDFDFLRVVLIILVIAFAVLKDNIISRFTFKDPLALAYCDNMFSSFLLLWVFLSAAIVLVIISKASAFFNCQEEVSQKDRLKARLIVYPIFAAVICLTAVFTYFGCNSKTILYSDTTLKNYNIFGKTDLEFNCNDDTVYVKIAPEHTGRHGGYNGVFRIIYKDNEIILSSTDFKSDQAIKKFTDSLKNEPIIEVPFEFKESFEDTSPNEHQQFLYDTYFKPLAER